MGHFLVWILNTFNISLGLSFLFGGALTAVAVVVLRNILPTRKEYIIRLTRARGKENYYKKSVSKICSQIASAFLQYPRDNSLFALFVVFIYVAFFQSFSYLSLNDPTNSVLGPVSYAYPIVALVITPFLGVLLQKIGIIKALLLSIVNLCIFIIFVTIPNYLIQIIGEILGILELSLLLIITVMWVLSYAASDLLGTCFGMFAGISGGFQVLINIGLPMIIEPLVRQSKYSYFVSFLLAGSLAVAANME